MGQQHFVAKIEVAPAFDPEQITEEDLDADHLEFIADLIATSGPSTAEDFSEVAPRKFQFELCPTCSRNYLQAPLGPARSSTRLKYSQN